MSTKEQNYQKRREYIKNYMLRYRANNREEIKEYRKKWNLEHKDEVKEYRKKWEGENKDKIRKWKGDWQRRNKDKKNSTACTVYQNMRNQVLTHYGGDPPKCNCCNESVKNFLTIDHINGGGSKEFYGEHQGNLRSYIKSIIIRNYPPIYQILCYNCNCGRHKNKNGICPHKEILD